MEAILIIASVAIAFFLISLLSSQEENDASSRLPASLEPASTESLPDDLLRRDRMFADVSAKAQYQRKQVLHAKELELMTKLEQMVAKGGAWKLARAVRVLPQVSLGEALSAQHNKGTSKKFNALAQSAINSKRIDLLLTCYYCHPRVAVELQGWRHTSDPKQMLRDATKRNALASAGIALVEIGADEAEADYMPRIRKALADTYPAAFVAKGWSPGKANQNAAATQPGAEV